MQKERFLLDFGVEMVKCGNSRFDEFLKISQGPENTVLMPKKRRKESQGVKKIKAKELNKLNLAIHPGKQIHPKAHF